jgi:hypothetical protein
VLVLAVLIPVAVIGLVIWIIVGMKQRGVEPFTLASATALYAHLMIIVSATAALIGGLLLVKVLAGFININYSYSGFFSGSSSGNVCPAGVPANVCNPAPPQADFTPQRTQDLVLGLTLVIVGVAAAVAHRALTRALRSSPGGRPLWVERGAAIAFTTLYGFGALFGLIAGASALISYFVVPGSPTSGYTNVITTTSGGQPFGDLVGAAIVFIPAWAVVALSLRRTLKSSAPLPPPATGPVMS